MGRIIKDILSENIKKHNEALEEYSDFLQGVPTFTTYFNKDMINSDQDSSLETVLEVIGTESPIKYKKIENFVMYNIEDIKVALEDGDFGLSAGGESTAVIPPGTIKPLPNDYFFIDYNGEEFRYRVTDVETSKVNGTKFYQISFELSSSNINIEEQVSETLVQESRFDGNSAKTLVKSSSHDLLVNLKRCRRELIEYYNKFYINNYFRLPMIDGKIYDNELAVFMYKNQLLVNENLRGIFYLPVYKETSQSIILYNSTIFKALEDDNIDNFFATKHYYHENTKNTQFQYSKDNILVVDYSFKMENFIRENLDDNIRQNMKINEPTDVIIDYFNDYESLRDKIIFYCSSIKMEDVKINYYLIPILLFIIKKIIMEIEVEGRY